MKKKLSGPAINLKDNISFIHDSLIVINKKGLIIQWEGAANSVFNFSESDVIDKHIGILFSNHEKEKNEIIKAILAEEKLIDYHTILLDKDQNNVFAKISVIPVKDNKKNLIYFNLIILQETTEILLKNQLTELSQLYNSITNNVHFGLLIIDSDTNEILFFNQYSKNILELEATQRNKIWDIIHTDDFEKIRQIIYPISETSPNIPYEIKFTGAKFKMDFWAEAFFSKLNYANRPSLLIVFQNISDRKKFINRLQSSIKENETEMMTKARFMANMSHEIRSPINIILGYLEILLFEENLQPETREFLTYINKSAEHLLKILNDILDLSKAEAGKLKLVEKPYNLITLMKSVLSMIEVKLIGKKVALDYNSSIESDAYFILDGHNLQRVLLNCLTNAVKFTEEGFISVSVKYVGNVLTFAVKDTGIGMSESEVKRLFIPFEQAHPEISAKYGGTGLGLAISKDICSLWGGEIWLESEKNIGTTVTFTYPAVRTEKMDDAESQDATLDITSIQGKKILVVDDQEYNHKLFKLMLNICEVETIFSGKLAINKLITEEYDGLLIDLHLLDLSGMDVLKEIQKRERLKKLKIIVISSDIMSNLKTEIEKMGYLFIPKPIRRNDLLNNFIKLFS